MLRRKQNKKITVIWDDDKQEETYLTTSDDDSIKRKITECIGLLEDGFIMGETVPSKLTPKEYLEKGFTFVKHVALVDGWRMIYGMRGINKYEILAVILDYDDHKKYDNRFNY
jgi:hypothetical protein